MYAAGAACAKEARALEEAQTALVEAKSPKLQIATLDLLAQLARRCEAARTQMRDGPSIPTAVKFLKASVEDSAAAEVGQEREVRNFENRFCYLSFLRGK